jgi:hypothetical protein
MIWYFSVIKKQKIHDVEIRLLEHEHKKEDKFIKDEYSVIFYSIKNDEVIKESKFKNKNDALTFYSEAVEFYENKTHDVLSFI